MPNTICFVDCWQLFDPGGRGVCVMEFDGAPTLFLFRTEEIAKEFRRRLLDATWTSARCMADLVLSHAALLQFHGCRKFAWVESADDDGLLFRRGEMIAMAAVSRRSLADGLVVAVENEIHRITDEPEE